LFQALLGAKGLNTSLAMAEGEGGETILHILARCISNDYFRDSEIYFDNDLGWDQDHFDRIQTDCREYRLPYRKLVRECLAAGANPNAVDAWGLSPLFKITHYFKIHNEQVASQKPFDHLKEILEEWLEDLFTCGVDLQEYGEEEMLYFDTDDICGCPACYTDNNDICFPRCVGFSFGPHPKDWHFWFADQTDCFAGEFWRMIEGRPPRRPDAEGRISDDWWPDDEDEEGEKLSLPGAWVED